MNRLNQVNTGLHYLGLEEVHPAIILGTTFLIFQCNVYASVVVVAESLVQMSTSYSLNMGCRSRTIVFPLNGFVLINCIEPRSRNTFKMTVKDNINIFNNFTKCNCVRYMSSLF